MWYIKCVSEIHIVLPMTCDPPRNVKMPELFTLRHFSHQFLLYFRLQNRSPALHQPYRQYNFLGNRLILQAFRNILHTQFCHFLHRLMDRRDLGCCNRRYHHVVEADQLDILRHAFVHLCAYLDHLRGDQITAGKIPSTSGNSCSALRIKSS